jgi:hypothetical protein
VKTRDERGLTIPVGEHPAGRGRTGRVRSEEDAMRGESHRRQRLDVLVGFLDHGHARANTGRRARRTRAPASKAAAWLDERARPGPVVLAAGLLGDWRRGWMPHWRGNGPVGGAAAGGGAATKGSSGERGWSHGGSRESGVGSRVR